MNTVRTSLSASSAFVNSDVVAGALESIHGAVDSASVDMIQEARRLADAKRGILNGYGFDADDIRKRVAEEVARRNLRAGKVYGIPVRETMQAHAESKSIIQSGTMANPDGTGGYLWFLHESVQHGFSLMVYEISGNAPDKPHLSPEVIVFSGIQPMRSMRFDDLPIWKRADRMRAAVRRAIAAQKRGDVLSAEELKAS